MSGDMEERHSPMIQPYRGEDWNTLVAQSPAIFGADLEKGNALIGVPFVLVQITIRPGEYTHVACGAAHPYASLDVITGPEHEIARGQRRGRIPDPCPVDPGEILVINEAGTGAYRQVIEYLEDLGLVELDTSLPKAGKFGECRYDALASTWKVGGFVQGTRFGPDGTEVEPTLTFDARLHAPRGLRLSEYSNEYTKEGHTRYFA